MATKKVKIGERGSRHTLSMWVSPFPKKFADNVAGVYEIEVPDEGDLKELYNSLTNGKRIIEVS